jgi:hypothetical protein
VGLSERVITMSKEKYYMTRGIKMQIEDAFDSLRRIYNDDYIDPMTKRRKVERIKKNINNYKDIYRNLLKIA